MLGGLAGESMFREDGTSLVIHGGLALRTDGRSRSEIEITDLRTGESETMVFAGQNRWLIVHQLILLIREHFAPYSLPGNDDIDTSDHCANCSGLGMYEDEEGNWPDCNECRRG